MKLFLAAILLLLALAFTGWSQEKSLPPAQAEVVNAERAFAKLCVERGVRDSFIAYFAEDGIGFGPHPHRVKETLSQRPAPATRPPIILNWAPVYGDIAQAGDLGWNTGPTIVEDTSPEKRPTQHGMFFSVWKKQSDGTWKVVVDLGGGTPAAVVPLNAPFQTMYRAPSKQPANVNVAEETAALLKVEREFFAAAKATSAGQAYKNYLKDEARVQRVGAMPVVGKEAVRAWLAQQTMTLSGEPIKVEVSRSGDFGYAYGGYELGGAQPQKGYYARVWKREANGQWRIEIDVASPLPPGTELQLAPPQAASPDALAQKAAGHYQAQQWAEAAATYQQYLSQRPNDAVAWHRLGTSQIYLKQFSEAIKNLEQSIKISGGQAIDFYNLACAFALAGEKDKALDNLEKAVNAGFTDKQQITGDTDLESLRETERFKQLIKRLG